MPWDPINNVLTSVPVPDHPPDQIGGPFTDGLRGRTFVYKYPTGLEYTLSFDANYVYFNPPPEITAVATEGYVGIKYRARELREDLYLVHWFVPGRVGHITLALDLANGRVDGAALMPGQFELFDRAFFRETYANGESALYTKK